LADGFTKPVGAAKLREFKNNLNLVSGGWGWGGC
jgi:hypothetical protein